MITVSMTYRVVPGRESRFEELYQELLAVLNHAEGHLGSRLFREVEDPSCYMAVSEWLDEESLNTAVDSKPFREAVDWAGEGVLAGRILHRVL